MYTVYQLAKISGVSGRTLRYYDQIDLLRPAYINASGYRVYEEKEADLLQQILFFREMDFRLEDIKKIIYDPTFNQIEALKKHYDSLEQKRTRLDLLLETVAKTIENKESGIIMQDKEKFTGFKEALIEENEAKYGQEIRDTYGDETIDASHTKWRDMSQEDYKAMQQLEQGVFRLLKEAIATGDATSEASQHLAETHKKWLMYSWTSYSKEAHAGLAEMYVADERFAAYYDSVVPGGAAFLRDAIRVYTGNQN